MIYSYNIYFLNEPRGKLVPYKRLLISHRNKRRNGICLLDQVYRPINSALCW